MGKKKKSNEPVFESSVTDNDLADARLALALAIVGSDNGGEIVEAMHNLTLTQAKRAEETYKTGNKKLAKRWKHSADEFFTVMMCAVYTRQDQNNE